MKSNCKKVFLRVLAGVLVATLAIPGACFAVGIPFAPAVNYGAGDYPRSVFCADLDNDNDLDLAVPNNGSDNVSIFKNNGDGTFQAALSYAAGDGPTSVFCADLDNDNDLDLAVTNEYSNNVSILKNNGDGTFQTAVNYGAGGGPHSVFCADLDNDDDLDLAVANYHSNNVSILKNNGNGTFQAAVNYGAGSGLYSVFCADLDNDNDLDLAVANRNSNNVSIFKNNGNGTLQTAANYGVGVGPTCVFCADLDKDNDLDLAAANWQSNNISILKNSGNGTFQTAVNYGAGNGAHSVFCVDLDNDTHLDLAVANRNSNDVSILSNNGDGTFQTAVNYGAGSGPLSVFCADLDNDNDLDLAVANTYSNNVSILINLSQGGNQPPGLMAHWNFDESSGTVLHDVAGGVHNHNGTIYGNPAWEQGADGTGHCLRFDGVDDYVEIDNYVSDFAFANESVTFTAWVQIVDNINDYRSFVCLGDGDASDKYPCIWLGKSRSGFIQGRLFMEVVRKDETTYIATSDDDGQALPKNQWMHLAGVVDYESSVVKLYVNGVLQNNPGFLGDFDISQASPLKLRLGWSAWDYDGYWRFHKGLMDEVRIYNRALSEPEIQELAGVTENQAPVADAGGPYSGLVGEPIQFDASGSYDPDGQIVSYEWKWFSGDSWHNEGINPSHVYSTPGSYTVTLRVEDTNGAVDTDEATVTVGQVKGRILVYVTGFNMDAFDGDLPQILWDYGYSTIVTDRAHTPTVTPSLLANYDQLWIMSTGFNTEGCFAEPEANAILSFRQEGHGLLITAAGNVSAELGYANDANCVAIPLGVVFFLAANHEGPGIQPDFANHPLFWGVSIVRGANGEALMFVRGRAQVIGRYQGQTIVALLDLGSGRVVFDNSFHRFGDGVSGVLLGDGAQYVRNIADWLSQGGNNDPPSAFINDIRPNPTAGAETISLLGSGQDWDGSLNAYNWRVIYEGTEILSSNQAQWAISTSGLLSGEYTALFKVRDNDGAWSDEVSETFVVTPGEGGRVFEPPYTVYYPNCYHEHEPLGIADATSNCNQRLGGVIAATSAFIGGAAAQAGIKVPVYVGTHKTVTIVAEGIHSGGAYTVGPAAVSSTEKVLWVDDRFFRDYIDFPFEVEWFLNELTYFATLYFMTDPWPGTPGWQAVKLWTETFCQLEDFKGFLENLGQILADQKGDVFRIAQTVDLDPGTHWVTAGLRTNASGFICGTGISIMIGGVTRITVLGMDSPDLPLVQAPEFGYVFQLYRIWVTSTDPNNDQVQYKVEWGDGTASDWTSLGTSGSPVPMDHIYLGTGQYQIRVVSRDADLMESDAAYHTVTIGVGHPLTITGYCPVDLSITDPEGRSVDKTNSGIPFASYVETDLNSDGELDDQIHIPFGLDGRYEVQVVPEPGADPTESFSIHVSCDEDTFVLVEDVAISDIPDQPYGFWTIAVGSISGTVSDSLGGLLNVTVDLFDSTGMLAQFAYTDTSGYFEFDSVGAGNYTISMVTPLGYVADFESRPITITWNADSVVNFTLHALEIIPSQRSKGYWKHQVNVHLSGKGNAQESLAEMSNYMGLIDQHFNNNLANPVTIFEVPQPADQTDSLEALQELLTVKGNEGMNAKAKQQLIALLLNVVSLKLHQTTPISEDSATVSQAITYCNQLITDADESNDELAKDIADQINNGMLLASGIIPLTIPDIMYRSTEDQTAQMSNLPDEFSLEQNCPNPFNPVCEIAYALPTDCRVTLSIYNILGQKVTVLVDEYQSAGRKSVKWDSKDDQGQEVTSGIYIYRMQAGDFALSKRMVLLK